MALTRDVVIKLLGDADSAVRATKAAAAAAGVSAAEYRRAEREHARLAATARRAAEEQQAAMASTGRAMMVGGAVIAAGLGLAAKAAIDWESAWAGVTKTVEDGADLGKLEGDLRNLATTLPATHEEIAGVAEAAGQLGIASGDIVEFTKVAVAMGVSTNLSAEEAATGLARFSNIMGSSSGDVDRLGSSLVALGNAGASTEGEILDMGLRIAAAGRQAGMSEGEVLGLANAMSSLGIEAEAGGTAISTTIKKINSAVIDGGDELEAFAEVAGMSAQDFAKAWRDDAAGATVKFVEGLHRVEESGGNVNTVLGDLGLDGIRVSDTLLRLAGDSDGLAASLATGNEAWAENDALMNEANKRYETTASKIQIARNQINDAAIDIGGMLLPALSSVIGLVSDFARGFSDLPGPVKATVTVIGVLAATVGILGGAAMIAVPKLIAFRTTMSTLASGSGAAKTALGKFGLFMTGPWGAAIGAATLGLGALVTWLGSSGRASEEAASYQEELAAALRETNGVIDESVRAIAAHQAADKKIGDSNLLAVAQQLGFDLPRVTDALLGNKAAYEELTGAANAYIDQSLLAENAGDPKFTENAENARLFIAALTDLSPSVGRAVAENQRLADAQKASGGSAENTRSSMGSLAEVTGDVAASSEDAATAAETLAEVLDELNGPTLDMREAARGYQDAIDDAADSLKEHGRTLDINTEAGRANSKALDSIATAAMEQANAIAANGGSYEQFRTSLEASRKALIKTATDMGMSEEAAKALADEILAIPDAAEVDIDLPTYDEVTAELDTVHKKVKGLPPNTTLNVGVLSQAAIDELERIGVKVKLLPDGTVEVTTSGTGDVETELERLTRTREAIIKVTEVYNTNYNTANARDGFSGRRAQGGPVGYAGGGLPPLGDMTLVGEHGPELVRFGARGYVTPADLTRQALSAAGTALAAGVAAPTSTSTTYARTFAPHIEVHNHGRPTTARDALDAARDYEWLHGG